MTEAETDALAEVLKVYSGSDGEATRCLFKRLGDIGGAGALAIELFRAQKNSERAKVYRGGMRGRGSFRGMAYDRKQWAMDNLANTLLSAAGAELGLVWGWGVDPAQPRHNHVLYVDLPTGQVSFHTEARGPGPDYPGAWDGMPGRSPERICRFVASVLAAEPVLP